ncbi:MAG: acyl-CoA dehydrogenase family protein [Acidimicrobiales bacterium]|jgi:hypothetical protein
MDEGDRELFERSIRHACETHSGAPLDLVLDELGWHEALSEDARTAISFLFEFQGTANATSSAIDAVLGSALGLKTRPPTAVVLPALGEWRAPGEIVGGELSIRGLWTASLPDRATASVAARCDGGERILEVATADLVLRPVQGIDPDLGLVEVTGDGIPAGTDRALVTGEWSRAVGLAQLAVGHELVGAARAMLELARGHALERIQFGQPIGRFQAVRHRLADTLVAIEAADAALGAAWEERSPEAAAMAKALAGHGARTAARHCQQVLAGIGFTTEHDLHRYVRRVFVLDQLLGAGRTLTRNLGDELLATRRLPALPPL